MKPVIWSIPALKQLQDIQDYIAQDSPSAAFRVANEIYSRTSTALAANPMIGRRGRVARTRELVFADLPYIVVYRVGEFVEIASVRHAARKWPRSFENG